MYFDGARNRYAGVISLGHEPNGRRIRRTVRGKAKAEVRQKLKQLHAELDVGVTPVSASYTARAAVEDWLEQGLGGRSERTAELYWDAVRPLVDLTSGQDGKPSKALNSEQARALLQAAASCGRSEAEPRPWIYAYVVLLLTTGVRPEEARVLRWDHVDLSAGTMAVLRSDRAGGDTKTARSRRTLRLAAMAVEALRERGAAQAAGRLAAGEAWHEEGLVFTTAVSTMLDQHKHPADVPEGHPGCWARHGVGSPGAAPHVREPDVRERRVG